VSTEVVQPLEGAGGSLLLLPLVAHEFFELDAPMPVDQPALQSPGFDLPDRVGAPWRAQTACHAAVHLGQQRHVSGRMAP
jgi:hypothetical protein